MSGGFTEFTFGKGDSGFAGRAKRFKAEAGKTYLVSFIWIDGLAEGKLNFGTEDDPTNPKFLGANVHYIKDVGYVVNKGPEYTKLAGEAPRGRIGTIIVVWPTDKNGKLDKTALANNQDAIEVARWIFSQDKYRSLQQINEQFPLTLHDVLLTCTDSGYQKVTFTPSKNSLVHTLSSKPEGAQIMSRIMEEANRVASDIQNDIGQELTIAQIQEKLSGAGITVPAMGDSATATGSNIDEYVGNLLDD
jgi:hypothetical protein